MISASDLAYMQATSSLTRTTPCQIQRVTRTPDGFGAVAESWATIDSPLCRLVPYKRLDYEQVADERLQLDNRWQVYLPVTTDITERDRVVVNGTTFQVSSVQGPWSVEIERSVLCYEVH